MIKKLLLFIAVGILFSGCAYFESEDTDTSMEQSSQELVNEGSAAFVAGEYKDAIKAYTDLRDWYPFSKYAILAELKIADSHFHLEEYAEAIVGYEEFERLHPRNEAIPYVIYQNGMSWFSQIGTIDRDHTPAIKSLAQFKRLIRQYPNSEYATKAQKKMKACRDNMSGHELYVANWYLKMKDYPAALKRFEYLVEHYPDSKESKEALAKIPQVKALIKK